jgi:transcription initiation factor IIE alpha subunit
MFLKTETQENQYLRRSKCGVEHSFSRRKTLAVFRCDNCDQEFARDLKHMDRKRLSNNYFHCCANCDPKRFAQRKGVEQKKIWDMPASTTLPVGKY